MITKKKSKERCKKMTEHMKDAGNYIQYPVINHNGKNMKKNIYV